jgi:O-antigen ligase
LQYGYDKALPIAYDKEHIPTHSFLLGAWVHSGLLGAIFWFWILVICVKSLLTIPQRQDLLAPIFAFICFNMLWNTLFSPLGAEMRLYTAFNLVFLMFMHDRLTSKRETVCTAVK